MTIEKEKKVNNKGIEGANEGQTVVGKGDTVTVHYKGTLEDGSVFDSSYDRGPISFTTGAGQMIRGFETNILGMNLGQTKKFTIPHTEAYGDHDPTAVQKIRKENFPSDFSFEIGTMVQGTNPAGQPVMARIVEDFDAEVSLDFNHPMAGKDLTFEVELVSIDTEEEGE